MKEAPAETRCSSGRMRLCVVGLLILGSVGSTLRFLTTKYTKQQISTKHDKHNKHNNGNYHISSYGADGIGHQIEAKLSCLAVAVALNWT